MSVDESIVTNLHAAYQPDVLETWPVRPELDVISRNTRGEEHAPAGIVEELRAAFAGRGWAVGNSETYPMHPSALAWDHVRARPGRVLCLEVRRDLLATEFEPFAEMTIDSEKVQHLAAPLAEVLSGSISASS